MVTRRIAVGGERQWPVISLGDMQLNYNREFWLLIAQNDIYTKLT